MRQPLEEPVLVNLANEERTNWKSVGRRAQSWVKRVVKRGRGNPERNLKKVILMELSRLCLQFTSIRNDNFHTEKEHYRCDKKCRFGINFTVGWKTK